MMDESVLVLEAEVAELKCQLEAAKQTNLVLRRQLAALRAEENRRRKWEYDHVPYGDDDYDR